MFPTVARSALACSPAVAMSIAWKELIQQLCPSGSRGSSSTKATSKCPVRLLDTIFIDPVNNNLSWYFTTKSGYISRKKDANDLTDESITTVIDRFSKFALANPNNTEKMVGVLITGSGSRQVMSLAQLSELTKNNLMAFAQSGSFLQVYLRPCKGSNTLLLCECAINPDGQTLSYQSFKMQAAPGSGAKEPLHDKSVIEQLITFSQKIATHLRRTQSLIVYEMTVHYILDDNEHIWLSAVPTMRAEVGEVDGRVYDLSAATALETVVESENNRNAVQSLPSISQDTDKKRPDSSSSYIDGFGDNPNSIGRRKSLRGDDESLISKEGTVYRCSLGPDDLPGLRAWSLSALPGRTGEDLRWSVDLEEYRAPPGSPNPAVEAVRLQRASTRHKAPYSIVALAQAAQKILMGKADIQSEEEFEQAWQKMHRGVLLSAEASKRGASEVVVCGNMNALCKKLESLSKFSFRSSSFKSVSPSATVAPKFFAEDVDGGADHKSSPRSEARPHTDQSNRASSSRLGSGARSHGAMAFEEEGSSAQGRRVLSAGQKPLVEQSFSTEGFADGSDFEDRNTNKNGSSKHVVKEVKMKEAYGDGSLFSSRGKDGSKKVAPKKAGAFRRDGSEPPSVELMAKFALEKEQQLKKQQQRRQIPSDTVYDDADGNNNAASGNEYLDDDNDASQRRARGARAAKPNKKRTLAASKKNRSGPRVLDADVFDALAQGGGYAYNPQQFNPLSQASVYSASESDFMARAALNGDLGSVIGGIDDASILSTNSLVSNKNTILQKINDALRERVDVLEKQCQKMERDVERKDADFEKCEQRLRRVALELESTRKGASKEIQLLIESHEKDLIRLREQHSRDMADMTLGIEDPSDPFPLPKRQDNSQGANKNIIEQLENLQAEYRKLKEKASDDRRSMAVENSSKLVSQERLFKVEMLHMKAELTRLEDKITQQQDEVFTVNAKYQGLDAMNRQLVNEKNEALDAQQRLQAELKAMQASSAASYKLESSSSISMGVDADSAIRLNEASSEAKVRTLNNKVEFLKAQLGAEQAAMEEMRAAVDANRKVQDDMKKEFRYQLAEQEKTKAKSIEEAERRLESIYEERMRELTTLQTKFLKVQGQLQDAYAETTQSKSAVDSFKAQSMKAQATEATLRTEIEQLRTTVKEMREEREDLARQDANKHTQEAVIRRLDNERQYLKSQLASEITHKNELQSALTLAQTQLTNVNTQWKVDVDTLKETLAKDGKEASQVHQHLQQAKLHLDSEVARLSTQNKDLKEAFQKARDQVRIEQLAIEGANSYNNRMTEQLQDAMRDIGLLKVAERETAEQHNQQISALKRTLEEQDDRRLREIMDLKTKLSGQYLTNVDAQKELLELRELFESERAKVSRRIAAYAILNQLSRTRRSRVGQMFRLWSTNATLVGVATQFRGHVNSLIKDTMEEERQKRDAAVKLAQQSAAEERERDSREMLAKCDMMILNARKQGEAAKLEALERAEEDFQLRLEDEQQSMLAQVEVYKQQLQAQKEGELERKDLERREVEGRYQQDLVVKEAEAQQRVARAAKDALEASNDAWSAKTAALELDLEERHRVEAARVELDHHGALQKKVRQMLDEFAERERALAEKEQRALDDAYDAQLQALELQKQQLLQQQDADSAAAAESFDERLSEQRHNWHAETETRIRLLREAWEDERLASLAQKDAELEVVMQQRSDAFELSFEAERKRGVKLEAAKWRQALKDAEKRFDAEVGKAFAEGRAAGDLAGQHERQSLENVHSLNMLKEKELHKVDMEEQRSRHDQELRNTKEQLQVEMEKTVRYNTSVIKEEMEAEWRDKYKKGVEAAWTDSAAMWEARLAKESDKLEKFKREVNQQTAFMAQERAELIDKLTATEETAKKIEDIHRAERSALRHDYEREREALEARHQREKSMGTKELERQHQDALEAADARGKEERERKLKIQKEALTSEMDKQMHQLQHESERLITGLENAMADLKREKTALSETLEKTTAKLEDTEDSLYDKQQEAKKKDKEHSVLMWRTVASVMRMRVRFQQGMTEFDKESSNAADKMRRLLQKKIDDVTLVALKLSSAIHENERLRKSTHNVLVSHKVDVLADTRTKIKLLEKEIERMQLEKDSLEEQRDLTEEDVEKMEGQVRELEDMIREHSRNSSMANGRVNVAHARKKRRLDSELERLLESIEQKRAYMSELDERSADKSRQREEKEGDMIDLEKTLVEILVEQQRLVMTLVEDARITEEKAKVVAHMARLPYPPPKDVELPYVQAFNEKIRKEEADKVLSGEGGDK